MNYIAKTVFGTFVLSGILTGIGECSRNKDGFPYLQDQLRKAQETIIQQDKRIIALLQEKLNILEKKDETKLKALNIIQPGFLDVVEQSAEPNFHKKVLAGAHFVKELGERKILEGKDPNVPIQDFTGYFTENEIDQIIEFLWARGVYFCDLSDDEIRGLDKNGLLTPEDFERIKNIRKNVCPKECMIAAMEEVSLKMLVETLSETVKILEAIQEGQKD